MVENVKTRVTAAEFFELSETDQPSELFNGEIIMSPPPIPKHQLIVLEAAVVIRGLIPHGRVFVAPIGIRLDDENVPEPDVSWIAADNTRCTVGDKYISGPPDLIVEVLSPGTARFDKTTKFHLYEKHGVREYWMVDPDQQLIEVWKLDNAAFVRQGIFGPDETFHSPVLGDREVNVTAILSV